MEKNELFTVSKTTWKYGKGEWTICGGEHAANCYEKSFIGYWFALGCPWFQVRFERNLLQAYSKYDKNMP